MPIPGEAHYMNRVTMKTSEATRRKAGFAFWALAVAIILGLMTLLTKVELSLYQSIILCCLPVVGLYAGQMSAVGGKCSVIEED